MKYFLTILLFVIALSAAVSPPAHAYQSCADLFAASSQESLSPHGQTYVRMLQTALDLRALKLQEVNSLLRSERPANPYSKKEFNSTRMRFQGVFAELLNAGLSSEWAQIKNEIRKVFEIENKNQKNSEISRESTAQILHLKKVQSIDVNGTPQRDSIEFELENKQSKEKELWSIVATLQGGNVVFTNLTDISAGRVAKKIVLKLAQSASAIPKVFDYRGQKWLAVGTGEDAVRFVNIEEFIENDGARNTYQSIYLPLGKNKPDVLSDPIMVKDNVWFVVSINKELASVILDMDGIVEAERLRLAQKTSVLQYEGPRVSHRGNVIGSFINKDNDDKIWTTLITDAGKVYSFKVQDVIGQKNMAENVKTVELPEGSSAVGFPLQFMAQLNDKAVKSMVIPAENGIYFYKVNDLFKLNSDDINYVFYPILGETSGRMHAFQRKSAVGEHEETWIIYRTTDRQINFLNVSKQLSSNDKAEPNQYIVDHRQFVGSASFKFKDQAWVVVSTNSGTGSSVYLLNADDIIEQKNTLSGTSALESIEYEGVSYVSVPRVFYLNNEIYLSVGALDYKQHIYQLTFTSEPN